MKAYRVAYKRLPTAEDADGIIRVESAGQARYLTMLGAQDHLPGASIIDFSARRAPEYDDWQLPYGKCISMEYVHIYTPQED